jgi:hypothetical protein
VLFTTHVVFGIDDKLFTVLDQGSVRTKPDTFQIAGIPHPRVSADAVRWLIIAQSDNPQSRSCDLDNKGLHEYYMNEVNKKIFNAALQRALKAPKKLLPHGTLTAHLYLFEKASSKATKAFADDLAEQTRGGRKLLEKLEKLRAQNLGRMHENQRNALIIQAWTAYNNGVSLMAGMLDWTETKDYPKIG